MYNVEFCFGQNAKDNDYFEAVDPSLEFFINSEDITNIRTPATLLIFNNEKGFSSKNIDSICSVGRSPKKCGYIGERYFTKFLRIIAYTSHSTVGIVMRNVLIYGLKAQICVKTHELV